jgi:hypothetical protein
MIIGFTPRYVLKATCVNLEYTNGVRALASLNFVSYLMCVAGGLTFNYSTSTLNLHVFKDDFAGTWMGSSLPLVSCIVNLARIFWRLPTPHSLYRSIDLLSCIVTNAIQ